MITIDVQIHGYRKGHQLLGSSIVLAKDDQAVIDRLSDVAGPLRPKEQFIPYLTTYPLPSGDYYVVARTWQDLSVPRAGCVRTKSLLVNAQSWSKKAILATLLKLIESKDLPLEEDAVRYDLIEQRDDILPEVSRFNANEFLEALFLEESKPIVVFDAPDPEKIAVHLLTALWPSLRKRFSLSTFALSPRKIDGRDLDIVFAPSNAKARFSDWVGRRIDGRSSQVERHRWTKELVTRVFKESAPKLLSADKINLLGNNDESNPAALRIALMWDELISSMDVDPTSVLSLLDIVNSGRVSSVEAIKQLEPKLIESIGNAGTVLTSNDAWNFVSSVSKKLKGKNVASGTIALEKLVRHLSEKSGDGLAKLLNQPDPDSVIKALIPSIAKGLGGAPDVLIKRTLNNIPVEMFAHLIEEGKELAKFVSKDDELIYKVGVVLSEIDKSLAYDTGKALLPFIVDDRQLPLAIPIIRSLNLNEVIKEMLWLRDVNGLKSESICAELINRARQVDGINAARDLIIASNSEVDSDKLLSLTVNPVKNDVVWLINDSRLSSESSGSLLAGILRRADDEQFKELLSDREIGCCIVSRLKEDSIDLLIRAVNKAELPIDIYVKVINLILPKVDGASKREIAEIAIKRCLRNRFDGDESEIIKSFINVSKDRFNFEEMIREGLNICVAADIASRNLTIFDNLNAEIRNNIILKVNVIALVLLERKIMDLTEEAYDACARLMFDADHLSSNSLSEAAGVLMPSLMLARNKPVSLMVAALFPVVYRELAKSDTVPEQFNSIFFFLDWDRCKTARKEITRAFVLSKWRPGDLALTACRCGDATKIIKQLSKTYRGKEYILKIAKDLNNYNVETRDAISPIIKEIINDWD